MYCTKCGAQNQDGEKFCVQCGANIMEAPAPSSAFTESVPTQTPKQKKKLPKWALIAIPAAVILLIILIVCLIINGNTVKMDKQYVDFEVEGYDGYGSVYAEVDWEAVSKKYGSKLKKAFKGGDGLGDMLDPVAVMSMFVDVELDYEGGLKNGDSVKYKWVVDDKLYDLFDIKFKFKNGSYKVKGLQKVKTFDIFNSLTVTFDGYEGYGEVIISNLSKYITVDSYENLSNGDTVTLRVNSKYINEIIDAVGAAPESLTKEYTVSDLRATTEYNPFDHLELTLSGMNGFTTASLSYIGGYLDADEFTISKSENLSNGDVITVTISENVCEKHAKNEGVRFSQTSKEFTVSDRNSYVTKLSDISVEQWDELKSIANNTYTADIPNYPNTATSESNEYIGAHLLTAKSGDGSCLFLVYKESIHLKYQGYKYYGIFDMRYETFEKTVGIYNVHVFKTFTTNTEGELSYEYDGICGVDGYVDSGLYANKNGIGGTYKWGFYCYDTYDEFYTNVIEYNAEDWNNEDNID